MIRHFRYGPNLSPVHIHLDYTDSQLPGSDKWLYAEGHVFSVMDPVYTDIFLPDF